MRWDEMAWDGMAWHGKNKWGNKKDNLWGVQDV